MSALKLMALVAILFGATACGDTWGQRAVTGGAIGAGGGAVVGATTGLGVLPGALIGGAVGAGVGAATTPEYSN
ncbi:MAG: bacteriocin [Reyranella sp.]|nr:bacteriocin [Reyranella sp.]